MGKDSFQTASEKMAKQFLKLLLVFLILPSTGKEYYNVSHKIGRKTMNFSLPVSLKSLAINGGVLCSDAFVDCSSLENISLGISTKSVPSALVAGHYGDAQLYSNK